MSLLPFKLAQSGASTLYSLNNFQRLILGSTSSNLIQVRHAARKGTRERKRKAKVKTVVEKVGFIPHNQRDKAKLLASRVSRKYNDSNKKDLLDNVYIMKYFKWPTFSFPQAVDFHRETHHPEVYNKPGANLHVTIELNMQAEKKTRFVDNFTRIAPIPHRFSHGEERSVIAFCKEHDQQLAAIEAGAQLSGGVDLIKQIQNGQVSLTEYQFVLANPDILPDLLVLRGLMKRKFPNPKAGTLDVDVTGMVNKFIYGVNYTAKKDEYEKDFGLIETVIGNLAMNNKQLEENFMYLIQDVYKMKPKRDGNFITRCLLWSPPSQEKWKVEFEKYVVSNNTVDDVEEERIAL